MTIRKNFIWAFIGHRRPASIGNARCSSCNKYFKFFLDYFSGASRKKCTHCGNTDNNPFIALDMNGCSLTDEQLESLEKANKVITKYVTKYPPKLNDDSSPA